MKRTSCLRIISACLAVFALVAWYGFLKRPFPFLDVHYVTQRAVFDAPPSQGDSNGSAYAVPDLPAQVLDKGRALLAKTIGKSSPSSEELLKALVFTTREVMNQTAGDTCRAPHEVFERSPDFQRICSEYAKVFCVLSQANGYTARVIWKQGHTTAEIHLPGEGWVHADPYGNIGFRDQKGNLLGLLEYRASPESASLLRLDSHPGHRGQPDFVDSFETVRHLYESNELYLVLFGGSLFGYPSSHRDPVRIFQSVFNARNLGEGMQFLGEGGSLPMVGNFGLDAVRRIPHL